MRKFKDYIAEAKVNGQPIKTLTTSNILIPLTTARADGIKEMEVSREEYRMLVLYFAPDVYWDGKTIWGIPLVIREDDQNN